MVRLIGLGCFPATPCMCFVIEEMNHLLDSWAKHHFAQ